MTEPWTYREDVFTGAGVSLIGFDVEATDGKIGSPHRRGARPRSLSERGVPPSVGAPLS